MSSSKNWKWGAVRNVLLTVIVGPMVGAVFMFVYLIGTDYVDAGSFTYIAPIYVIGVLVYAYLLGGVPAVVTGLTVWLIRPKCPTRHSRLLGASGVGAVSVIGFFVVYAYVAPDHSILSIAALTVLATCGAFAAFVCSFILEWLRWHTPPRPTGGS